jgi:hypothetical protein
LVSGPDHPRNRAIGHHQWCSTESANYARQKSVFTPLHVLMPRIWNGNDLLSEHNRPYRVEVSASWVADNNAIRPIKAGRNGERQDPATQAGHVQDRDIQSGVVKDHNGTHPLALADDPYGRAGVASDDMTGCDDVVRGSDKPCARFVMLTSVCEDRNDTVCRDRQKGGREGFFGYGEACTTGLRP